MREQLVYLTTSQIARRWNRTPDRVRQLARAGRLRPALLVGAGQRLFTEAEVQRCEREERLAAHA